MHSSRFTFSLFQFTIVKLSNRKLRHIYSIYTCVYVCELISMFIHCTSCEFFCDLTHLIIDNRESEAIIWPVSILKAFCFSCDNTVSRALTHNKIIRASTKQSNLTVFADSRGMVWIGNEFGMCLSFKIVQNRMWWASLYFPLDLKIKMFEMKISFSENRVRPS